MLIIKSPTGKYEEVTNYSSLPLASDNIGKVYLVLEPEGVFLINRKPAGLWRSNGLDWIRVTGLDLNHEHDGATDLKSGFLTNAAQTIAGVKTFISDILIGTNGLYFDTINNRIKFGDTPSSATTFLLKGQAADANLFTLITSGGKITQSISNSGVMGFYGSSTLGTVRIYSRISYSYFLSIMHDTNHNVVFDQNISNFLFQTNGTQRLKIGNDGTIGFGSVTTTERDTIATPTAGDIIYNSTTNKLNFYNGTAWEAVTSA